MPGTVAGGRKAADTNKELYGKDFYARIGRIGGKVSKPNGGFGCKEKDKNGLTGRERASLAGTLGGLHSRRTRNERDEYGRAIRKDGKLWGSPKE